MKLTDNPIARQILRRIYTPDEEVRIYEIVKDELSMVNPAYFDDENKFYDYVTNQVAVTYLYDFYESEKQKSFREIFPFIKNVVEDRWENYIKEYWLNEI